MVPTYPIRREFCRRLFRVGGATETLRNAFLDTLADSALAADCDDEMQLPSTADC